MMEQVMERFHAGLSPVTIASDLLAGVTVWWIISGFLARAVQG